MKALAPNTLLQNRYLIVQLIGKGGMGEVYLGVDQRLGSAVAIKRTFFSDDETLKLAFEREAKTLARLRHPSLPKVSDHFSENDIQYLVMEHISGEDLSKRLEITNEPFPLNWVLFWADQLLDGLTYLHSHEPPIIHRDIKPQNLKLTSDNHIILLDFGLAKNSIGETRLSTSGSVVGYTPHYASMEQIRGTGTTARSDIYSLCATLYQLLTNTVPPDALSRADNVLNGFPDVVKPLHELNPEVSQSISDVVLKGMSLSVEPRYATAREMQKALRTAFAQVKTSMTAQTEAFNIANVPQVANQIAAPPPEDLPGQIANQIPQSGNSASDSPTTPPNSSQIVPPIENFDATIPYNMPLAGNLPMTGDKTEIIPKGLSPADSFSPKDQPSDNYSNNESPAALYENFDEPEADNNQATAVNFISLPKTEPKAEVFAAPDSDPQTESVATPAPVKSAPPKKSGGKMFAVVGGIAALAILGIAAAVILLYALKPGSTTTSVTPTPLPTTTAEPTVEPTVAPTTEPTLQADTNSNTNTDTTLTTANTDAETSNSDISTTAQSTPRSPTERPTQTPATRVAPTPRTAPQATVKPPQSKPTTKPAVDDRTKILQ